MYAGGWHSARAVPALGLSGSPLGFIFQLLVTQWALKVGWEALLTPVTYATVGFLKRREGVDVFDEHTDFSPFRAKI